MAACPRGLVPVCLACIAPQLPEQEARIRNSEAGWPGVIAILQLIPDAPELLQNWLTLDLRIRHAFKNLTDLHFEFFQRPFDYSPDGDKVNAKVIVDEHVSEA